MIRSVPSSAIVPDGWKLSPCRQLTSASVFLFYFSDSAAPSRRTKPFRNRKDVFFFLKTKKNRARKYSSFLFPSLLRNNHRMEEDNGRVVGERDGKKNHLRFFFLKIYMYIFFSVHRPWRPRPAGVPCSSTTNSINNKMNPPPLEPSEKRTSQNENSQGVVPVRQKYWKKRENK